MSSSVTWFAFSYREEMMARMAAQRSAFAQKNEDALKQDAAVEQKEKKEEEASSILRSNRSLWSHDCCFP